MAAQAAFDPFAGDWDEHHHHHTQQARSPSPLPPPRLRRLSRYRSCPETDNHDTLLSKTVDVKKQLTSVGFVTDPNDIFSSTTLDDDDDEFSDVEWPVGSANELKCNNLNDIFLARESNDRLDGLVFNVHEEMSIMNRSQSKHKHCTVKVCGSVSVESPESQNKPCRLLLNFHDPQGHIDSIASDECNYVRKDELELEVIVPTEPITQLVQYTGSEKLCPVPMLVKTSVQDCGNHSKLSLQLMVNPRNTSPLVNAAVIVYVPFGYDGERSCVKQSQGDAGHIIDKGVIDSNWSGITRLLSWQLRELHSGAIYEFEAVFPTSSDDDDDDMDDIFTETMSDDSFKFPVLLRYDSAGSLLSGVRINCGRATGHSFKKGFRVYHRET